MNRFLLFWLLFIAGFGATPSFADSDNNALCFVENTSSQDGHSLEEAPRFKSNRLLFPPSGIPSLRVNYYAAPHLYLRKAPYFAAHLDGDSFATLSIVYTRCLQRTLVQTTSVLSYHLKPLLAYYSVHSFFCIWRK